MWSINPIQHVCERYALVEPAYGESPLLTLNVSALYGNLTGELHKRRNEAFWNTIF